MNLMRWAAAHLLDGELRERLRKTVELNLQFARFPYLKRLIEFDHVAQPGVDRRLVEELATGRFLYEGRSVVFLGPPGVGKTHLAIQPRRADGGAGTSRLLHDGDRDGKEAVKSDGGESAASRTQ
jgi:hypothetical protein